jgi:predicted ATPase
VQLDALRAGLADLDREPRRVVLVHGEAGIGKTRLLDELSRSLVRTAAWRSGVDHRSIPATPPELGSARMVPSAS